MPVHSLFHFLFLNYTELGNIIRDRNHQNSQADHPLLSAPNCVITPHIGSRTYESVPRQAMKSLTNLINALKGDNKVATP
jgi:D-3-phosphoglycerate dehydrogenase